MTIYTLHHTNKNLPTIDIDEQNIDQSTDITFFGRKRLRYGEEMNQNILHLLEHFACPELADKPGIPDLSIASENQISGFDYLARPVNGQLWYNSSQECLFVYDSVLYTWKPLGMLDDIAANWGIIYNGQQLPRPVSNNTGHVFDYSECSWIVSPYQFPTNIDYMLCNTDQNALVVSLYKPTSETEPYEGFANYLIIGIRDNINLGTLAPVPSPTPTPSITSTVTPTANLPTPTPSPNVTPTPTPSTAYSGPLFATLYNPNAFNNFFSGDVDPYYTLDFRDISYPGVTNRRHTLYTKSTLPISAPYNPWEPDPSDNNYYLYVSEFATGGEGAYPFNDVHYNRYIFVSNDGINGLFYKILSITRYASSSILKVRIDTSASLSSGYYNRIPLQTSPVPQLQFSNYQYVYVVGASSPSNPIDQSPFLFNCPTPYLQNFVLEVYGGAPPYTITDIRFSNGSHSRPVSAIASGMNLENFSGNPVSFYNIATIKNKFTGTINTSNPNVTSIPNGYRVNNFLTSDVYYPANYSSLYGTSCTPESFWLFDNTASVCSNYTGYITNLIGSEIIVEVTDSLGTLITTPLYSRWAFQTIDRKFPDSSLGLSTNISGMPVGQVATSSGSYGIPAGSVSPVPGTYSYDLDIDVLNRETSIYPTISLAQLKYLFSLIAPSDTTQRGSWLYTGDNLSTLVTGLCYVENDGLVHVGDPTVFTGRSPLIPYNGSTGSIQEISIVQYVNTNGNQVNISSNPIRIKLYPTNVGNAFTWRALKSDGTNNNLTQSSPLVPYDMKLDVIIPPGLPSSGSLVLPIAVTATQYPTLTGCFGTGTGGGVFNVQINFSNV